MEEKPSALMYIFVISVIAVASMFIICKSDNKMNRVKTKLEQCKTDDEKVDVLKKEMDKYDPSWEPTNHNISDKELINKMTRSLNYKEEEDARNLATGHVIVFFVIVAVLISVFKYIATVILGIRSAKNIIRRR